MRRKSSITVSFQDIALGGVCRVIKDGGWSADSGLVFQQKPEAVLTLHLQNENTVTLNGSLDAIVDSFCCRCGSATSFVVCEKFDYIFKLEQDQTLILEDIEFQSDDIEIVYVAKPEIKLEEVLREQLFLAIPEKLLCDQNCQGICQSCGALLSAEKCSCAEDMVDSPFAVLKRLKK